jgi:putative transcriptional regulator
MLFEQVARILENHSFNWCECRGCFDIAARKRDLIMLKVLDNVDSLQESQAQNLITLSDKLDATVSLVGTHTRYERLRDNIIYERFDVPTFTPNTLDSILEDNNPLVYRNKGGYFAEINPAVLKRARIRAGLTQQQLADSAGVTKKSIYEHEARPMKAQYEVAMRIEKLLGEKMVVPFEQFPFESTEQSAPASLFEKSVGNQLRRIGFATSFVGQSPFNVIAEERVLIVSDAEQNPRKIERKSEQLEQFADVSDRPIVVISEVEPRTNLPSITTAELKNLSAKSLRKLATK